ncbi:uncharacterized protein LOC142575924 isoform X2 [Dermacentor variabilis]|uniref:uncharacterized protein LOC142575924 isoform X2 n=1 Tax=Dermacentor variabilis TaxID=34621 RepID=UPI003F5C6907
MRELVCERGAVTSGGICLALAHYLSVSVHADSWKQTTVEKNPLLSSVAGEKVIRDFMRRKSQLSAPFVFLGTLALTHRYCTSKSEVGRQLIRL